MPSIIVIAHNIRSTHNIGAIFRSCDGFGVERVILSGYSPYPSLSDDTRLPHLREKITNQIQKTALGAEAIVPFTYSQQPPLHELRRAGYRIVALEQAASSIPISTYDVHEKIVLLLGEEVEGVSPELLAVCDDIVEIPMYGHKESFNVSVACGIALYALTQ